MSSFPPNAHTPKVGVSQVFVRRVVLVLGLLFLLSFFGFMAFTFLNAPSGAFLLLGPELSGDARQEQSALDKKIRKEQ